MLTEIKAILVAVALAWVAYLGFNYHRAVTKLAAAQEAAATAQAQVGKLQATAALRGKLRAATGQQTAKAAASLQAAVASAPAWASEPVPQEVQDALTQ